MKLLKDLIEQATNALNEINSGIPVSEVTKKHEYRPLFNHVVAVEAETDYDGAEQLHPQDYNFYVKWVYNRHSSVHSLIGYLIQHNPHLID